MAAAASNGAASDAVVVEALEVDDGSRPILRIPKLAIPEGVIAVVLGPGGSGKSTLLRVLCRSAPARLRIAGRVESPPDAVFVPQPPASQTGGRGNLARVHAALAAEPPLLALDEPDAGLDDDARARLMEGLRALRGRATVVVATHNLALARELADLLVLLIDGEVHEQGPAERLLARPESERTRYFLRMGS